MKYFMKNIVTFSKVWSLELNYNLYCLMGFYRKCYKCNC